MRPIGEDQIVSFDFTPPDLVPISDYRAHCKLFTVPGRIAEPGVLQRVMSELDGILFVADSQCERVEENVEALLQLASLPGLADVPMVFLYNKRDLPNAAPIEYLDLVLNRLGAPRFSAIATKGEGLAPALSELSRLALR